jgi:curved DNA-binding protein CbpA
MQQMRISPNLRPQYLGYDEIQMLASLILDEPNHYTVLGVDSAASYEEINQSYCIAVTYFHPLNHRSVVASDKVLHWLLSRAFTRLSQAHRILSNARRRALYDRSLKAGPAEATAGQQAAGTAGEHSLSDKEQLNLQSYSYATPEWLSSKRGQSHVLNGERRRVVRVKMCIPVVVTCESYWQETGETRDLSPLGAKLRLARPIEPGTLVRLQLRMPKQFRTKNYNDEIYQVSARVLRQAERGRSYLISVEFI